ncbi:hypothetical protein D3C73_1329980 [compost metagenome]
MSFRMLGARILRMNSSSLHTRKIKIKAFDIRYLNAAWYKLNLRINHTHLRQGPLPVLIKIHWTRIDSCIGFQLL